jgi:hypothetical protein
MSKNWRLIRALLSTASTSAGWRPSSESKSTPANAVFRPQCALPLTLQCYPNYALGQTDDWMNEIYPTN